jgi:hypothetical protein
MMFTRPSDLPQARDYRPLPDNVARQAIDASFVFEEHRRLQAAAGRYAGGMYWKRQGDYEYLVRTKPNGAQSRLGARSAATESVYTGFVAEKAATEARVRSLRESLTEAERQNKALRVGRMPSIAIGILNALDASGVGDHFSVVGTYAMYAYETAAGVRIDQGALATQDVDLLWDARGHVRFISDVRRQNVSMLRLLQNLDSSFKRDEGQPEAAVNDSGFKVEFLKREPEPGDPHPFAFTSEEGELYPVQARRASVLAEAPRFESIVVGATGRMARMRTIDPTTFVRFKRWMAESAIDREPIKRRRDAYQASVVQSLLDDGLLTTKVAAQTTE